MCGGGGGPNTTYSEVTQSTSNLPEWARPYYEDLLARTGYETSTQYIPYEGQRLAYFDPAEQEAMARMTELGQTDYYDNIMSNAMGMAANAGQGFDPGISTNITSNYRPDAPNRVRYTAGQRESQYAANQMNPDDYSFTPGYRDVEFVPGTLADQDMIQQYMSPYIQSVIDIQKREAMRDADMRHQQLGLDSSQAGGPRGNYRLAMLEAETERDLGQRLDDLQAEGLQSAYLNAQQAFEADRAARAQLEGFEQSQFEMNNALQARAAELVQQGFSINEAARQAQEEFAQSQFGMNEQFRQAQANIEMAKYQAYEQAKQQAAAMGLSAQQANQAGEIAAAQIMLGQQQNALSASNMLGQLGGQDQAMYMDRLNAMVNAGNAQRQLMQTSLDIGYQDFLNQQAWPREQLAFYSSMLQGTPVQPGTTTATYGPEASLAQQLFGSGIAGVSLYNALNGGGGQ